MTNQEFTFEDLDPESNQFLIDSFAPAFRRVYVKCNGFVFPEHLKKYAERIRDMEIRDDDIWVCTFPKSGTTWLQEMAWLLIKDLDFEGAKTKLSERFPILEFSVTFDYNTIKEENAKFADAHCAFDSIDKIDKMKSPRFIKTHLPFSLLPAKLQNFSTKAKIIHMIRNPRDNVLSRCHYVSLMQGYRGSFEKYAELYLNGNIPHGPVPDHLKGFLKHADNPNVLSLRFEDMVKDLKSVILKMASFLGKDLSADATNKLLNHLSFDNMSKNPAVNHRGALEERKQHNVVEREGQVFRRGAVGIWKKEMDPKLQQRFEKWEKENFSEIEFNFYL